MDDAERAARARDEHQRELARLQAARETFDWVSNFNRTQASQIEQDNLRAERARTETPAPVRHEPGPAAGPDPSDWLESAAGEEAGRESERVRAARETFDWVSNFNRTQASQIEQDNLRTERACGAEKRVADARDDGLRNLDAPPPRTSDPVPDAMARPDADLPERPPPDPLPPRPLSPPGVPTDPVLRELLPSDHDTVTRLLSDLTLIGDRMDTAAALRANGNVAQAQAAERAAREVYDFWSAFYRNQERIALIAERLHELTAASIESAETDRVAGQRVAQTLDGAVEPPPKTYSQMTGAAGSPTRTAKDI